MWMNIPGPGFGMKVAGGAPASAGPNSPGTIANATGPGSLAWDNPTNAASSNNSYASALFFFGVGGPTQILKCTNFGFSIPSDATITGITVEVERKQAGSVGENIRDVRMRLVKEGTVQTPDKSATGTNWPTSDTYATYGGAADLWSGTWTPSDVNDSGFGVGIAAQWNALDPESAAITAYIDHIRITINYTS